MVCRRRHFVKALVRWATGTRLTSTLPPFEQRDSWSSYGAVRAYSEVLYNLWGPSESDSSDSSHEEIHFSLKSVFIRAKRVSNCYMQEKKN